MKKAKQEESISRTRVILLINEYLKCHVDKKDKDTKRTLRAIRHDVIHNLKPV